METLTTQLLDAIDNGELCDLSLTAFEPEANGNLVEGLGFHETYFGSPISSKRKSTVRSPQIRMLGDTTAVVAYVRLVQSTTSDRQHRTTAFEETRVWHKIAGIWKMYISTDQMLEESNWVKPFHR